MSSHVAPGERRSGPGNLLRVAVFAGAFVVLVGIALAAGGLGPWVARPLAPSTPRPQTRIQTPPTMPSVSMPDRPDQPSAPTTLGWGVRLVVIAILVILVIVIGRWLYGRFRELAHRHTAPAGPPTLVELAGDHRPPPVLEREGGRHFDPRQAADAIISCWLWVERSAVGTPSARQEHDTPTEFLDRYVANRTDENWSDENRSDDPASSARAAADELLPLYQRARFDHVALTADAATRARAAAGVLCSGARRAGRYVDESAADNHGAATGPGDPS